jgi:hypothetical protein
MRHVHLRQGIGEAKVAADKQVGTVKQHAEDTREEEVSVSIGGDQARPSEVRVVVTEDQAVVGESANVDLPIVKTQGQRLVGRRHVVKWIDP